MAGGNNKALLYLPRTRGSMLPQKHKRVLFLRGLICPDQETGRARAMPISLIACESLNFPHGWGFFLRREPCCTCWSSWMFSDDEVLFGWLPLSKLRRELYGIFDGEFFSMTCGQTAFETSDPDSESGSDKLFVFKTAYHRAEVWIIGSGLFADCSEICGWSSLADGLWGHVKHRGRDMQRRRRLGVPLRF